MLVKAMVMVITMVMLAVEKVHIHATQNTHNTVAASPLVSCPSVKMESMAF